MIDYEEYMKNIVIHLEAPDEPINFSHSMLGNYFLKVDFENFMIDIAQVKLDAPYELFHCTQIREFSCINSDVQHF